MAILEGRNKPETAWVAFLKADKEAGVFIRP
ncbi:hypothetical protein [Shinella zoogloeoides]